MDNLFDVIIVGASDNGTHLFHKLIKKGKQNVAIISNSNLPVPRRGGVAISDTALQITYKHGLIGVLLKDSADTVWGKNLVVATGRRNLAKTVDSPRVVFDIKDIKRTIGLLKKPIVMTGNGRSAVARAIELSKDFPLVYFCSEEADPCESDAINKMLRLDSKITFLGLCKVTDIIMDNKTATRLREVKLSTGTGLYCGQLLLTPKYVVDFDWAAPTFLGRTQSNFADVTDRYESKLVPNIYAIGPIVEHWNTKGSFKLFSNMLIKKLED